MDGGRRPAWVYAVAGASALATFAGLAFLAAVLILLVLPDVSMPARWRGTLVIACVVVPFSAAVGVFRASLED